MTHARRSHKRKGHEEEEHENHERWLVSYADMLTLLFCLFVVLFAMSTVDQKKLNALAVGLQQGFGAPMSILTDGTASKASADSLNVAIPAPVNITAQAQQNHGQTSASNKSSTGTIAQTLQQQAEQQAEAKLQAQHVQQVEREAGAAYNNLKQAEQQIQAALAAAGYPNAARYSITARGLIVSITADQVLFDAESATLRPEGQRVLDAVTPTLRVLPNQLSIDGHANNIPVTRGGPWPSNWELSAYRATTVLRYIASPGEVADTRMTATSYSDTDPLVPNSDPTAITVNRRVDIVILSNASAEANALLPGLDAAARNSTKPN